MAIDRVLSLADAAEAHRLLEAPATTGKVLLSLSRGAGPSAATARHRGYARGALPARWRWRILSPMSTPSAANPLLDAWISGGASACELVELALDAERRHNPTLNAVVLRCPERARAAARALDAASARGEAPTLAGMPVTLKDNIDVAGLATSAGSPWFAGRVAESHATVAERLERAGAIIVGKANLHELALGATGQSAHLGPCYNPWHIAHVPGGSSSGSGAATAAGLCVASLGSDTGGSIRNPAAFNGVAGLKATHGRVPNRGSVPVSATHDCIGPLAARVEDVARVYAAIAGYDLEDPTSVEREVEDPLARIEAGVAGLRIGVPESFYYEDVDDEVESAVREMLATLVGLGAEHVPVDLPGAAEAWRLASQVVVMTDAAALHRDRMARDGNRMGADVHARVAPGREIPGTEYCEALAFGREWRVTLRRAFERCDLLLAPTCPFGAPRIEACTDMAGTSNQINRFNFTFSFAGVPALSVPCGFSAAGLPLGAQLVGPWWHEARLLRAGFAWQQVSDHHLRTPALLA